MSKRSQLSFRTATILLLFLSGIAWVIVSCGDSDDGDSGGRNFSLPAGIQVQSAIGDGYYNGRRCSVAGNGTKGARFIYITLVNTTSVAIEVTIPAGLIFDSTSTNPPNGVQHVMVLQDNTFIVESGAHSFCIWVICAGGGGDVPRDEFSYDFGPFVVHECQWEIIDLLQGKHLANMSPSDARHLFSMAGICASRGGLTDEDREFLRSLP